MKMRKELILWLGAMGLLSAGGYKIPEQSLEGMALGAAHIAHTTGADSAYYNPANMAFLAPLPVKDPRNVEVHPF